jgi:GxxExxY protein
MNENEIAKIIVDACYRIHTKLGPGLFESVYETILEYELEKSGLKTRRQYPIPVFWEDRRMDLGFRADLLVNDLVVVEIKSVELLAPVHKKQVITYLRLTECKLGLLINFNTGLIKDGITRLVNKL